MISNTLPQSLIDNPILSQWIAFEQPGRVRVGSGKVEIGQGILTALTQIAAEELDVSPEQVNLVSGQTDVSPGEGFTSGSYSIAVGGASLRLACAEVRRLFLQHAATKIGCPAAELAVRDGHFLRNGHGRAWVKLTGTYRMATLPALSDAAPMARALIEAAPDRLIWGSDYPHLSFADKIGSVQLFNLLADWASDAAIRRRILVDNPARLYGF